ncbi:unnamed protein product [Kuraishia capsulata CBS 1993]|uniref:LSM domain-containing protein n=1 Tax=Kuraishia capsulata CBS 1993 TaxID=1382522 RepID=W6MNH6_9ASCO|nr:uncharacterized protein KUCA_T00004201001 [Kuraishia capsulata CBS 1993]CDK28219.1 unnamed protein product [Kuraishia capsulata CBS 1993]
MAVGIPVKLLNEAQGHVISLELTSGETYRGKLLECELFFMFFFWLLSAY